jgi:hypothetical protein
VFHYELFFKKSHQNDSHFDMAMTYIKAKLILKMATFLFFEFLYSFTKAPRSTRNYSTNHLKGLFPMKCIPISALVKNTEEVRTNGK